jgi:GDP-4-dehydro-6-deoxy-D-mannose reductase
MQNVLVTGIGGFVGGHIRQILSGTTGDLRLVVSQKKLELLDLDGLVEIIRETRPGFIIHLAAQSFVPSSFEDPKHTFDVNFYGTLNLLVALKTCRFKGRLLYVGSAQVYGIVPPEALPVQETQPLMPRNPYAVSKAAAEFLCYQWSQTEDVDIVMARPFNHIGPDQNDNFTVSNFAKQLASIKLGRRPPILEAGNLDATRDFTDVRDVVEAYFLLLKRGKKGEVYNVCSGKEYSIRDILQKMMLLSRVPAEIKQEAGRLRKEEQQRMLGSYAKLHEATGWQPRFTLEQSLTDVLTQWERQLKND